MRTVRFLRYAVILPFRRAKRDLPFRGSNKDLPFRGSNKDLRIKKHRGVKRDPLIKNYLIKTDSSNPRA
jgi:hypothetical protein